MKKRSAIEKGPQGVNSIKTDVLPNDSSLTTEYVNEIRTRVNRLREQRESRGSIDLMALLEEFPEAARPHLLKPTQSIECADGCTGGCPWCAFNVKRKITTGFSFESLETFIEKHITQAHQVVAMYHATDPLDIAGHKQSGEQYDYVDVVKVLLKNIAPGQKIYTSTVMPEGTYEIAIKLIVCLHNHWIENRCPENFHTVRFSMTDRNKENIDRLRKELESKYHLHPGFLNAQFGSIESREQPQDNVLKVGNFVKHPDRNLNDVNAFNTVACYDGILIKNDGYYFLAMEAVTRQNPYGQINIKIDPKAEKIKVPIFVSIDDYRDDRCKQQIIAGETPSLLPNIKFKVVESKTGALLEIKEMPTVRRDLLAYIWVCALLGSVLEEKLNSKQKIALSKVESEMDERWKQTRELFADCDDDEAKEAANLWYGVAKHYFCETLECHN